ncbi:MAG: hypothetical protein Q8Q04_03180 [archaeon]|nr:hypothetical protein [archaeon]
MLMFLIYASLVDGLLRNLSFDIPYTSKSQNIPLSDKIQYSPKNFPRKTFFPLYSKTSKMTYDNRYGRHINLERRVKGGKHLKWK